MNYYYLKVTIRKSSEVSHSDTPWETKKSRLPSRRYLIKAFNLQMQPLSVRPISRLRLKTALRLRQRHSSALSPALGSIPIKTKGGISPRRCGNASPTIPASISEAPSSARTSGTRPQKNCGRQATLSGSTTLRHSKATVSLLFLLSYSCCKASTY